jgi:hypothetical protein
MVTISDRIHADSFMAANRLLWGEYGLDTKFVDGEITVLMSMDPFNPAPGRDALEQEKHKIIEQYNSTVSQHNSTVRQYEAARKVVETIGPRVLERLPPGLSLPGPGVARGTGHPKTRCGTGKDSGKSSPKARKLFRN